MTTEVGSARPGDGADALAGRVDDTRSSPEASPRAGGSGLLWMTILLVVVACAVKWLQ